MHYNINGFREPQISYKYSKTIRPDVLNYRQAVDEEEMHPALCNCTSYDMKFIDGHHKHVFTCDLAIANNNSLKNLLRKGLNFREPQPPNKVKAYESIMSALDSYIHVMSTTLNKPVITFRDWRTIILEEVKKRLETIRPYIYNKVLSKNAEEVKAFIQFIKTLC